MEESSRQAEPAGSIEDQHSSSVKNRCLFHSSLSFFMIFPEGMFRNLLSCNSEDCDSCQDKNFRILRCCYFLLPCYFSSISSIRQISYNYRHASQLQILYYMSLNALLLASHVDSQLLYTYKSPSFSIDITKDTRLILSKARSLGNIKGQRQRLNTDYGAWLVIRSQENIFFAICVSEEYPQRTAFCLVKKIEQLIYDKYQNRSIEKEVKKSKQQIEDLCNRFRDPANIDKVREAQNAVEDLRGQLQKGVRGLFQNQQNLNKLTQKTGLMVGYAQQFEKTSQQAENKAFWHKWKAYLLIGIIIGSVLILCGIIVYVNSKQQS